MSVQDRIQRLQDQLREEGAKAALLNKVENIRYFSGFTGDDSLLLVTLDKCFLLTDSRYTEQAAAETSAEIVEQKNGLYPKAIDLVTQLGIKRLSFEAAAMLYQNYKKLAASLSAVELVESNFDALRQIKEAEEIQCIREAVRISDLAFEKILSYIRPGLSETDVATYLEQVMRANGSDRPAFMTIVASGVRGSLPHGIATEKLLVSGEFVTMDFGAVYHGYHSDITRTIVLGTATPWQRNVYTAVYEAQRLGKEAVKPGVSGIFPDKAARDHLTGCGYGEYFGHGLGHSLGLEIHEEPRLSPSSKCASLVPNMLITVEPGVYIPGKGGLRIEDTVLVTETGHESLTQADRQLIELV
ncbi:aminopeptidase PapA [Selenomonas sp. TAMA-11512]|uniref:M24 family metallopeptidase n=1 Tax=Selenomonas sp. TAMA-11512 TaxID=3095337 RepID=UPI003091919A|nr:aminopeptidase PapA [Selenomonas sp. TAMA-11512]